MADGAKKIDANNSMTPSPSSERQSKSYNMGFMPYPNSAGSYSGFGGYEGTCFPISHPQMSYMNMLNSPNLYLQPGHSSQGSGGVLPPSFERGAVHACDLTGSKRAFTEEVEENSPTKKKKRATKKRRTLSNDVPDTGSKGSGNKKWEPHHDDVLIPYLAKLAKDGFKPDKNFKQTAFSMAAAHINNKCKSDFSKENVINRMKSLKKQFYAMQACANTSGAGWDNETKSITLDEVSYDRWSEGNKASNSKLKDYFNKPLVHYENLQIIVGDDKAKGDLTFDIFDSFGSSKSIPISDEEDELPTPHSEKHASNTDDDQVENVTYTPTQPTNFKSAGGANTSTKPKGKKKVAKSNEDIDIITKFLEKVDSVSYSIQHAHMIHWTEKLSQVIQSHKDEYSELVLDKLYDKLFRDENEARYFIGKSVQSQSRYLASFVKDNGLDVEDIGST